MKNYSSDVTIMGGGLAGLGLARQLKHHKPELDIVVVEKNRFPLPHAIAKVGESTVEIGSHYLADTLDLREHFKQHHLRKFGIRCFFGEAQSDLSQQDELGGSKEFGLPTYQIDRGMLENHLSEQVQAAGVTLIDGAEIQQVELNGRKTLTLADRKIHARWLVDCAGRSGVLKNKMQLQKSNNHGGNAVWFRVDRRIEVDSWSSNPHWQAACQPAGKRWLSTNHLMGPGYWVWIIPLSSGVTSIGIVMDDICYRQANIHDKTSTLLWLQQNQGKLFEEVADATFLDFGAAENYSYACKKVFSGERWGISGEGGFFADPFYSPGTDFIAFGNGFISDLILRDMRGEEIQTQSIIYQKIFESFYSNTLSIYEGNYGGFGDRKMMGLKLLWDYAYYWGILGLLFFQEVYTDTGFMRKNAALLQRMQCLNHDMQSLFRQRAAQRLRLPNQGTFMDLCKIPCLLDLNRALSAQKHQRNLEQININAVTVERVYAYVKEVIDSDVATASSHLETDLFSDYRKALVA